jgi:beta-fructofuranosidase
MIHLHFKPSDGWLADVIPFYWDGQFHLFYLHDHRDVAHCGEGTPWRRISTTDFLHFEEAGEMLPRGGVDAQDLYVFTGSVIRANGQFHIFYTGHNPHLRAKGLAEEAVMHAVSEDLTHFAKVPEDTFFAPTHKGYEPHDWRDPFVFFDEGDGLYHMLLAARTAEGAKVRRGITAHLTSPDLKYWETIEPLWAPSLYFTHECPDLLKIGDWYYLIFSEFSDLSRTRYVMAKSLSGPWLSPRDDVFETRAFYAAKSASDGRKRYLFGWVPTRIDNSDAKPHMWGGAMAVHELYQRADGTLGVREPDSLKHYWRADGSPEQTLALSRTDGFAERILTDAAPEKLRISCRVRLGDNAREAGIRVGYDPREDLGFAFVLDARANLIRFKRLPNHPWGSTNMEGLERPLALTPNKPFGLTLLLDGAILTLYVDDCLAMTVRMCQPSGFAIAFFVSHGEATYEHVVCQAWMED